MALGGGLAAHQLSSRKIFLPLRDSGDVTSNVETRRLHGQCGSQGWIPPFSHTSATPEVRDHLCRGTVLPVYRADVRPKTGMSSLHQAHETDGALFTGAWYSGASLSRRFPVGSQHSGFVPASSGLIGTSDNAVRAHQKRAEVCVATHSINGTPWLHAGHSSDGFFSSTQKADRYQDSGVVFDTVCKVSPQVGEQVEVSVSSRQSHGTTACDPSSADTLSQPVFSNVGNSIVARGYSTIESGSQRLGMDESIDRGRLLQGHVATSTRFDNLDGCFRSSMGLDIAFSGGGSRFFHGGGLDSAHHLERAARCDRGTESFGSVAQLKNYSSDDRQSGRDARGEQGCLSFSSTYDGVSPHVGTVPAAWFSPSGELSTITSEFQGRFSVKDDTGIGVVALRGSSSPASVQVSDFRSGSVCNSRDVCLQAVQFSSTDPRQFRRCLQPQLGWNIQPGQPAVCPHQQGVDQDEIGISGWHCNSAVLAEPTVVATTDGVIDGNYSAIKARDNSGSDSQVFSDPGTASTQLETGNLLRSRLLQSAADLVEQALRPSTRRTYSSHVSVYEAICMSIDQPPFPVSIVSCNCFISALADRGFTVNSVRQHWSAVLHKHQSLGHGSVSDLISSTVCKLLQGLSNVKTSTCGPSPLLPHAESVVVMRCANMLLEQCELLTVQHQCQLAMAVFGYLFALRADTIYHVLVGDVSVSENQLVFKETTRKGKSPQQLRICKVPLSCKPALAISVYLSWYHGRGVGSSCSLFDLSGSSSASSVTCSLEIAFRLVGFHTVVQSHMLRRGAAIAMLACNVPVYRIMQWGAWSNAKSIATYVRGYAIVSATVEDRLFFSWLASTI